MFVKTWPLPEQQYLDILRYTRDHGFLDDCRQIDSATGQPLMAKTIFGEQIKIFPQDGFPLTQLRPLGKAMLWFMGEILWFLSGNTNVELAHKYGIHYWDDWCTKEKAGWYGRNEGEFGPIYGEQWRRFRVGNDLVDDQLAPRVVDQVRKLIDNAQARPTDRRLILTAWHPEDVYKLVIKPCHGDVHVRILGDHLDMVVRSYSADFPIGIPSNLVMYAFLQRLFCLKLGYKVGVYTHHLDDTHYYLNAEKGVEVLLSREAKPYPMLELDEAAFLRVFDLLLDGVEDPLALKEVNPDGLPYPEWIKRHIRLEGYDPYPAIPRELLPVAI